MLKVPLCWEAILLDVGGTGEGGRPSRLRLPKDVGGGLPRDVTERRPDVGEGEGRMRRGRLWEPTGSMASPEGGGEADDGDTKREAWCSAARCLRRALAAAPR